MMFINNLAYEANMGSDKALACGNCKMTNISKKFILNATI
jgi:hypothetical protein